MNDRPYTDWGFVLSGLITLGLLSLLVIDPWPDGPPGIILFFGRFHPLALHLPIGILVLAFALEIFSRVPNLEPIRDAVPFTLAVGASTAVLAALLGWCLSLEGGYNEALLADHMWQGIATAVASVWTLYARTLAAEGVWPGSGILYAILLVATMGLLSVAGHHGGSLTHGKDFLFKHMPDPMRETLQLPAAKTDHSTTPIPDDPAIYLDLIQPIFETRCITCHGPEKTKGDLRLDSYSAILRGGDLGPAIAPGNIQESELIFFITLPRDDEDAMPPAGKPQLTSEEIALITWWVQEGALPEARLSALDPPDEIRQIIQGL